MIPSSRAVLVLGLPFILALGLACGPQGPLGVLPGGPLAGEVVEGPVDDWAFTDDDAIVAIETRGRFIDHSVSVMCMAWNGNLYVPSRHAPKKRWVKNVLADPRVRIGVDDRIYEGRAYRVTDATESEAAARTLLHKYLGVEAEIVRPLQGPPEEGDDRAEVWIFRIESVGAES